MTIQDFKATASHYLLPPALLSCICILENIEMAEREISSPGCFNIMDPENLRYKNLFIHLFTLFIIHLSHRDSGWITHSMSI